MPNCPDLLPSFTTRDDQSAPNGLGGSIAENYVTDFISHHHAHWNRREHRLVQLLALPDRVLSLFTLSDILDNGRNADRFTTFIPLWSERNTAGQKITAFLATVGHKSEDSFAAHHLCDGLEILLS